MLGCGVLGYALKYMKIDLSSVVLGYILGPIAERGMVRTIIMEGSLGAAVMSIVTRPICIALIVISIVSLAVPFTIIGKVQSRLIQNICYQNKKGTIKNSPNRKIAEVVRLQRFFYITNYAAN